MSGIGKGITASSIARILKDYGFKVDVIKIDPYLNVDAGTLNPVVHGEVFVTDDGVEADQDLGNYERFLGQNMARENIMTSGLVYQSVINKERNLGYNGKDVQMMSDVPDEIISRFAAAEKKSSPDFIIVEIGGTVGDEENKVFLEAARVIRLNNPDKTLFVLVSYFPILYNVGEMKSKPTQHAVRALNSVGIKADIIIGRSPAEIDQPRKEKISRICNLAAEDIISAPDIEIVYQVPLNFEKDKVGKIILEKFKLKNRKIKDNSWRKMVKAINFAKKPLKIGIVGKYFINGKFVLTDAYISVIEAIKHASWSIKRKPEIIWISAEEYEERPQQLKELSGFDGVIVPGGWGVRGLEGKIKAIEYLRKQKVPFLGLCLGMQMAVVEYARNVLKIKNATSAEIDPGAKDRVIDVMPEQKKMIREKKYGGTNRLGAYLCRLKKGTVSFKAYGKKEISERHRHRYELNNDYLDRLEKSGMVIAGINPEHGLVEIIELKEHPFFVATQFHPELKSRPMSPHPLFRAFVLAASKKQKN
jgi:CTP synthase